MFWSCRRIGITRGSEISVRVNLEIRGSSELSLLEVVPEVLLLSFLLVASKKL